MHYNDTDETLGYSPENTQIKRTGRHFFITAGTSVVSYKEKIDHGVGIKYVISQIRLNRYHINFQ